MSKIRNNAITDSENGNLCVDLKSSGRSSPVQKRKTGCHHATARLKWLKKVNIVLIGFYYRSDPFDAKGVPLKAYRQRMYRE